MTRIIIVDDHPVVRAGLKQIISAAGDMVVADEVGTAEELIESLRRSDFDLAILDITLPGMDGFEALKRIKQMRPGLSVLILSMHSEEQFAARALKAGAAGYLTKTSAPKELIEAVRQIVRGKKFISAAFAEKLAASPHLSHSRLPHERLSGREFQVLRLIARGRTQSEIASELKLSVKTISTYRTRISEKMMLETTSELIAYAISNNLC